MPKGLKIVLFAVLPALLIVGGVYALAKFHIIPLPKNKQLEPLYKIAGLLPPKPAAKGPAVPPPDPLAKEKEELKQRQTALEKEKTALQNEQEVKQRQEKTARAAAENALPDPKNIARLAAVYEQMPAKNVAAIFAKLPDDQVVALLRLMDEKQVGQLLAAETPERAARMTQALARRAPALPAQTASNSP